MLKQTPTPAHVIALYLEGKVTGEDIEKYRSAFQEMLLQHSQVGVYVDLTELSDMSENAFLEGAMADMELFSHLSQFSRCALVSGREWPQAIASLIQQLFPTLDIKVRPAGCGKSSIP